MKRVQVSVRVSSMAHDKLSYLRQRLGISACQAVECAILDFDVSNRANQVVQELRDSDETSLSKKAA